MVVVVRVSQIRTQKNAMPHGSHETVSCLVTYVLACPSNKCSSKGLSGACHSFQPCAISPLVGSKVDPIKATGYMQVVEAVAELTT